MPGKDDAGRRRTGCWTCKKSHVQCKEEHPVCSRCTRLKLDCDYGLRLLWKEDAEQRNISLGREGKWSKNAKSTSTSSKSGPCDLYRPINLDAYVGKWIFLNVTEGDFTSQQNGDAEFVEQHLADLSDTESVDMTALVLQRSADFTVENPDFVMDITEFSPQLTQSLSSFANVSSTEVHLFDYFVSSICPNCSLSTSENPYLTLLTPMSFAFPVLNTAILAVSANQLNLLNDKRFQRDAWYYKSKAIQGVQQAINAGEVDVGIVATVLMLCFYDISDGCNSSWVTHLRGGLSLLDSLSGLSKSKSMTGEDTLLAFLRMYFVAHDIMFRTAYEEDIIVSDESHSWSDYETLDEIDVLMGCSRSLMSLIQQISSVTSRAKKIVQNNGAEEAVEFELLALSTTRNAIERSLHLLSQTLPENMSASSNLPRIAETKRLTAILYLRERLSFLPSPARAAQYSESYYSNLITQIIAMIKSLPDSSTLLWPLFILGTMGSGLNEEQRRFVLERLTDLQRVRNLGSVRRARTVVKDTWKRRDLNVNVRGNVGEMGRLDRHIISLA